MKTQTKRFLGILILATVMLAMSCDNGSTDGPDGHFQGIPVYGNMAAASLTLLQEWYDARDGLQKDKFKAGITRINIVGGSDATVSESTLTLGASAGLIQIIPTLAPIVAQLQPSNGVYLA